MRADPNSLQGNLSKTNIEENAPPQAGLSKSSAEAWCKGCGRFEEAFFISPQSRKVCGRFAEGPRKGLQKQNGHYHYGGAWHPVSPSRNCTKVCGSSAEATDPFGDQGLLFGHPWV